jgi:hypothetical protein
MQIFNYDPTTSALIGAGIADESPLEPGEFIVPAYATAIAPPDVPAGKYAAFDGEAWQLLDATGAIPEALAETAEQTIARYEAALDAWLDAKARMHRYDNRFAFALRAAYAGPWQAEGVAFAQWMDACNIAAFEVLTEVQAGTLALPSIDDFIAALPELAIA